MASEKTVSKLRSIPTPYVAQAPAPKLGARVDPNRWWDRVSSLLGPDLTEIRTLHQLGARRTSSWRFARRTQRSWTVRRGATTGEKGPWSMPTRLPVAKKKVSQDARHAATRNADFFA